MGGVAETTLSQCAQPTGYTAVSGDCEPPVQCVSEYAGGLRDGISMPAVAIVD